MCMGKNRDKRSETSEYWRFTDDHFQASGNMFGTIDGTQIKSKSK